MSQRNKRKERSSPESQTQPPPSPTHDPHIPSSSSSCSSAAYNFPYHPLLRPPPSTTHDAYIPSSPPSCSSAATNFPCDPWTNPIVLPPLPGFKFLPDDEDLILLLLYLKPFVEGNKNSPPNVPVHHVDVYDYDSNPDQLSKEFEKGNDKEWFFITERTKFRGDGSDNNGGSWKAITAPKKIKAGEGVVGYKTRLEYYIRKQPNGLKSDWLMNEYWIESSSHDDNKMDYALENYFPTPRGYQRTAEEEENEEKKEEEGIATEMEVDQPYTQKDYALCKIYLAEDVEDEEGLEASEEEVEQQASGVAFQQPNQPQAEEQGEPPLPFISDELVEMLNDHNIPDDVDGLFPPYDDLFTPEDRARYLEELARDAVKKH